MPAVAISRTIDRDLGAGSVSYTAPNLKSNSALFLVESKRYGAPAVGNTRYWPHISDFSVS
jgi:hypothetical protein